MDKEKGGAATVDANLRGWDGDAANKEKIQATAMEKEKERATRRTAIARSGAGAKTTTTKVAVEATVGRVGRIDMIKFVCMNS